MPTRRYAEDTSVPIARSRAEVDTLLRDWGAAGVQWTDNWERGEVTLRFGWLEPKTARKFTARVDLKLRTDVELRELARHKQTGQVAEGKLKKLQEGRGRQEHRVMALWLKAAFNAIEAGIISPEQLFLPWLEGADGTTVSQMVLPRLPALLGPGATRHLPPPESH